MPDTPSPQPQTVWAEDAADRRGPPPRTLPPRHTERMAADILRRVAAQGELPKPRPRWWAWAAGAGLMAAGGVLAWWRLDQPLLHLPSAVLLVGGFAVLVKTAMGYR